MDGFEKYGMKNHPDDQNNSMVMRWNNIILELDKETDRGAALFSASVLDQLVEEVITAYLISGKGSKAILKGNGDKHQ
jgi:hypothetical protein